MKRILLCALGVSLILSLAACGGAASAAPAAPAPAAESKAPEKAATPLESAASAAAEAQTISEAMSAAQDAAESLNRNNLTAAQIAEIEAEAAKDGVKVQWEPDGSMTVVEGDATTSFAGSWPESPLLKDVPKPKTGTIVASEVTDETCTIAMTMTADELKAYIEDVKAAGFTENAEETDMPDMGLTSYMGGKGGLTVNVFHMQGAAGIEVTKD